MEISTFFTELTLRGVTETEALGARIAASLAAGDTVALEGDLGAGKTTLARAVLAALDCREIVPSPSFTLVQRYETPRISVSHFDLYRIEQEPELEELGFDEALADGALLVEWPERAGARLPPDALHVRLAVVDETTRQAHLRGPSRWAAVFGEVPA